MDYDQLLNQLSQVRRTLEPNSALEYLLPKEAELLEQLPFLPQESVPYFSRQQAISLLNQFEIGITLEKKFK